jgi:hypothetical protein
MRENIPPVFLGKFTDVINGQIPPNVQERFNDWSRYGSGILETGKTMAFGHPEPMPREIRSSPHNMYIELAYTFGLLALLPKLILILYSILLWWRRRNFVGSQNWWLAAIVLYLVVIDSNFKVTLRQPYPGIFAYFMWGILLTQLQSRHPKDKF